MSLIRACTRMAAVLALRDRTQAGSAVFDSRLASIDELARDQAEPVISVYTDEHQRKNRQQASQINLIIEMSFAHVVEQDAYDETGVALFADDEKTEPLKQVHIWQPQTDQGLELALDLMEQQVLDCLSAAENDAADIFAELTMSTGANFVSSQRAIFDKDNAGRLAARQLFMTCTVLDNPQPGMEPPEAVLSLLDVMESDSYYARVAPSLRAFLDRDKDRDKSWQELAMLSGSRRMGADLRILGNETPGLEKPWRQVILPDITFEGPKND